MTRDDFTRLIERAIEAEEGSLTGTTRLLDISKWDSMGIVAFIAAVDDEFNVLLAAEEVTSAKTVGDLVALVSDGVQ